MKVRSLRIVVEFLLVVAIVACSEPQETTPVPKFVVSSSSDSVPRNLVLISLDTTRADHLPTYGYERQTAPRIDTLAKRSTVFTQAISQETNTNPSHSSMFTGLYPHVHGSLSNSHSLAEERVTLAEILSAAGFRCGGFVSAMPLAKIFNLQQGFEVWDDEDLLSKTRRPGAQTLDRALAWLKTLDPDERSFLFLHLFDAHGPYRVSEPYRKIFVSDSPGPPLREFPSRQFQPQGSDERARTLNPYRDIYDGAIRYLDDVVTRLLDVVDLERSVVLIVSDHGETMAERYWGLGHGGQVFDEQIRIPMILYVPGRPAARNDELVETVDFLPTLLDLLEVLPPEGMPQNGHSLVDLIANEKSAAVRTAAFSAARPEDRRHVDRGYQLDRRRRIHSIREGGFKLIRYPGKERDYFELYNLAADPLELENVAEEHPKLRRRLQLKLEAWHAGVYDNPVPTLSNQEREGLRDLGYLPE
jgi:arylsulfatase A-like enzyme